MEELTDVLSSLSCSPTQFAVSGVVNSTPLPGLHINDVGPISLPITSEQAKKITVVASKTSIKRTDNTDNNDDNENNENNDTNVVHECSSPWYIQPEQISFMNSVFVDKLEEIITDAKNGLGCNNANVKTELFKMMLLEEGSMFEPLQDCKTFNDIQPTFANLIIQLPSMFEGCNQKIQYESDDLDVKFGSERSPYEIIYTAYCTDCEHEVTPLLSGYRLVLVYNLVWCGPSVSPSLAGNYKNKEELIRLLQKLLETGRHDLFGWAFQNNYDNTFDIADLIGEDGNVASALLCANENLDLDNCFTFYIAEIQRKTTEYGTLNKLAHESNWFNGRFLYY